MVIILRWIENIRTLYCVPRTNIASCVDYAAFKTNRLTEKENRFVVQRWGVGGRGGIE